VIAVTQGQQNFRVICNLIDAHGSSTKQHISNEFEKQRKQLMAEDFRRRILESLYFPEFNVRQEDIKEAHKETFEWIYDKTGANLRPWSIFTQWLEQGRATYWICGKAGSGKSTLMNMIHQDERTINALRVWAGAAELLTPTFFFWNAGTELQKGSIGLLRSLLYQLISAVPAMTADFVMAMNSNGQHATQQLPVWTEQRLSSWLVRLIENELSAFRLCMFIDGLDEFTGDQDTLRSLIMKLIRFPNTKICLSSRPHLRYDDHFGSSAMLRLQDLTRSDISHYVHDRLADAALGYSPALQAPGWLQNCADKIVERAEGVFLWVALAVNDQTEGVYNDDNPQLLQERLDSFPSDLEGVYTLMIDRVDRVYRKECALYLRMAIDIEELWLNDLALAVYEGIDNFLGLFPNQPAIDLEKLCQSTSRRIRATCKGFLEIEQNNMDNARVVFVHRTAADFLQQNIVGTELLGLQSPIDVNTQEMCTKAQLARLILHDIFAPRKYQLHRHHDHHLIEYVTALLINLSRCQEVTGKTYSALAEMVDQVLSSPSSWDQPLPIGQHWSQIDWLGDLILFKKNDKMRYGSPRDFLGKAACHGLGLYVLQKLNSSVALQKQQYTNYLFSCIITTRAFHEWEVQHLKLMCALLRRGASPNLRIGESTLWSEFLERIHIALGSIASADDVDCKSTLSGDYCDVLLAFLESGADIQTAIPVSSSLPVDSTVLGTNLIYIPKDTVQLLLSPLDIVRRCFGSKGDFSSVEHAFTARQPSEHSVCTTVTISERRGYYETEMYIYELSARQSDRLLDIWAQYRTTSAKEYPAQRVLRREIKAICMELHDEEGIQARHQQQELQEEDDVSASDSSKSELSDEGSFHSANS